MNAKEALTFFDASSDPFKLGLMASIKCIHTKRTYKYDLSETPPSYKKLSCAFVWSLLKRRNAICHESRTKSIYAIRKFFIFLQKEIGTDHSIKPKNISKDLLQSFARHLKVDAGLDYRSASKTFLALTAVVKPWIGRSWAASNLEIPAGEFPKARSMQVRKKTFSGEQLKQITKAVIGDLALSKKRLETPYQRQWEGKEPPMDGISPFTVDTAIGSKWASDAYRVWWWETSAQHKKLGVHEIRQISGGYRFLSSLRKYEILLTDEKISTEEALTRFYKKNLTRGKYQIRYQECPIKYESCWLSWDYLVWYWENKCNCIVSTTIPLQSQFPSLLWGIKRQGLSLSEFYEKLGIVHRLKLEDLAPYYLILLATTALNTSTLQSLRIDCLSNDPFDSTQSSISWTKLRSHISDSTVPSQSDKENWPSDIVTRVIKITRPFRLNNNQNLWLSAHHNFQTAEARKPSPKIFNSVIERWFFRHGFTDVNSENYSENLKHCGNQFRSAIANEEYRRTADLEYVQKILGHANINETAGYIHSLDDPIIKFRRAIHLQALVIRFIDGEDSIQELMKLYDVDRNTAEMILAPNSKHETSIARCKDPMHSPIFGQKRNAPCTAHDSCLYCPNLVITPFDLTRFFSMVAYLDKELTSGNLSSDTYNSLIYEKKFIFETHIIPKFPNEVVAECRLLGSENPCLS